MSGSELGLVVSSLASSLFEQINTTTILSKIKYFIHKKVFLASYQCVVIDEYSCSKINVESLDKSCILFNPEKVLSLICSDNDRLNIRRLKLESYDSYLLLIHKRLKRLLNNMRFLHPKSMFIVCVSSHVLGKQLGFSEKKISNFIMDTELFNSVITKAHDTKELAYFNLMNYTQTQHSPSVIFDSFKQLNLLVCGLSKNKLTVSPVLVLMNAVKDELDDD